MEITNKINQYLNEVDDNQTKQIEALSKQVENLTKSKENVEDQKKKAEINLKIATLKKRIADIRSKIPAPKEANEAVLTADRVNRLHGKKKLDLLKKVKDIGVNLEDFATTLEKYYDDGTISRQEFSKMTRIFDNINDQLNDIYDIL